MDTRLVVGLVAGALLLGTFFLESEDTGPATLPTEYSQGPEALAWLKKSDNDSALASNRFGPTSGAVNFVKQLYSAGAVRVIVPLASITKDEVETYADCLVVTLPADPAKRKRVWDLCAKEIKREGGKPGDLGEENQVLLWWD